MLFAPEEFPEAFAAAWADRDASALAALFVEDADFVNVVGIWWSDRGAIEKAHHYGLSTFFRDSDLRVRKVKSRMVADGAAVVQARLSLTGQLGPDGERLGPRSTILTGVLQMQGNGRWLCVAAQNTDIVPGAETHIATDKGLSPKDYRR